MSRPRRSPVRRAATTRTGRRCATGARTAAWCWAAARWRCAVLGCAPPMASEGATENAGVVRDLLADLQQRGLDCDAPMLVVIDGSKALDAAVKRVFRYPAIQRCRLHKERDVDGYLPERERPWVRAKLRAA